MSHLGSRYNATMNSRRGSIPGGMFAIASALSLLLCVMMVTARVAVPRLPRDMLTARKIDTLSDQTRVTYNYGLTGFGLSFHRDRELLPGMKASRKSLPDFDGYGFSLYSGPSVATVFAVYSGRDVMYNEQSRCSPWCCRWLTVRACCADYPSAEPVTSAPPAATTSAPRLIAVRNAGRSR